MPSHNTYKYQNMLVHVHVYTFWDQLQTTQKIMRLHGSFCPSVCLCDLHEKKVRGQGQKAIIGFIPDGYEEAVSLLHLGRDPWNVLESRVFLHVDCLNINFTVRSLNHPAVRGHVGVILLKYRGWAGIVLGLVRQTGRGGEGGGVHIDFTVRALNHPAVRGHVCIKPYLSESVQWFKSKTLSTQNLQKFGL